MRVARALTFVLFVSIVSLFCFLYRPVRAHAQIIGQQLNPQREEVLEAQVLAVLDIQRIITDGREYKKQRLKVKILSGSIQGREVIVQSSNLPVFKETLYEKNDRILIGYLDEGISQEYFYIIGYSRTLPLASLASIFIGLTLLIIRSKGVRAFFGMFLSFIILIYFVLPLMLQGKNPVLVSSVAICIMIPALFYSTHGLSKKITIAAISTGLTLLVTVILGKIFVEWAHLTGTVFEETTTLLYVTGGHINLQGLIIAGIAIGALGILDDVTISQVTIIEELKKTAPRLAFNELYSKAMKIGIAHVSSVVNTLILVYTGTSLSALLLFIEYPRPFVVLLSNEVIAIQIVVSLVGTIGLILSVPITTFFASYWLATKKSKA